jgi:hypothetical protein
MHYEIQYQPGPAEDARAIRDAMEYLGHDKWCETFGQFIQPGASMSATPYSMKKRTIQMVRFACMLAGIQGRPVGAIIRGIWAAHR